LVHGKTECDEEVPKAFDYMLLQGSFAQALHPLQVLEGLKGLLEEGRKIHSRRSVVITSRGALEVCWDRDISSSFPLEDEARTGVLVLRGSGSTTPFFL